MIDGHGDDIFRYGDKIMVNFSSNIPQTVDHSGLLRHLAEKGDIFRNYPEPAPLGVERKIAAANEVSPENVVVTNGATEAIYMLAHLFMGSATAILGPTFSEYQDACRNFNHSVRFIASLDEIDGEMHTVWLCNPNNPTGKVYDRKELLDAIDAHPGKVFIIDQAYGAYSVKEVLTAGDILTRKNVVMLQSLTKQFVVPGLRIGYAIGPGEIMGRLRSLRMPWSVNSIAIEAAFYLMENASDYKIDAESMHREAIRMADAFREMGINACGTDCNFLLCELPSGTAGQLKGWLIERHGLLIRDASNFEGLSPRHFRVAAQSAEENDLLIDALKKWISSCR